MVFATKLWTEWVARKDAYFFPNSHAINPITNTTTKAIPNNAFPISHIQKRSGIRPINPITYNIVPTHPLLALISDEFDESLDLKMKYPMGSTTIATRIPIPTSEPCGNGKSGSFGSYLGPAKELNEIKNAANDKKNFLFFIWL